LEFNVPFQHKTVIIELLFWLGWLILLRLVIISYIYYTEETAQHLQEDIQEGQHPLTGQRAANFRRDLGAT